MKESILNLIGNTPLVRLRGQNFSCPVYGKLEDQNPGGSIKDRTALAMVEFAERKGWLKPGGTIVEASSGNQGIALAIIGAVKGYKVVITVSQKVSAQKIKILKAYGAKVVICPNVLGHNNPKGYYMRAKNLARRLGAYFLDQYNNSQNPLAHYRSTGPEIWRQTKGRVSHLFVAAGTTGTVMGTARFLKKKNKKIKVFLVDSANSAFSNPKPSAYKTEGMGIDFVPGFFDKKFIDKVFAISDAEAFTSCRELAKTQGLLAGGSSGAVYAAIKKYANNFQKNDLAIALFPDSGRSYVDKIF